MKTTISFLLLCFASTAFAQYNTTWYANPSAVSNTTSAGYIGIGTRSTTGTTNTPIPAFNFHLHGTADFFIEGGVENPSGMVTSSDHESESENTGALRALVNVGKTTRFGMTNTTTGMLQTDGTIFRMSGNDFSLANSENGNMAFSVPNVGMIFSNSTKRIWVGGTMTTTASNARFNIVAPGTDNGLFIQTTNSSRFGLSVKVSTNTSDAILVYGSNTTTKNFKVTGGGEVFARKYTTTLNSIPDYVFDPSYNLMPLTDLRTFVNTERHLPNIPSATEYAESGVDLGELNRLLLEKTEELTLYILQLEERLHKLETQE